MVVLKMKKLENIIKFVVPVALAVGIYKVYKIGKEYIPLSDDAYMERIRGEGL